MRLSPYLSLRPKIQNGDVYFTAETGLYSRLIRFFTRGEISHCGVFVRIGGRLFVVESLASGVTMNLASNRLKGPIVVCRPKKVPAVFLEEALRFIGKPYDWVGAIGCLFFINHNNSFFCSEFCAKVLDLDFSHLRKSPQPIDLYTGLHQHTLSPNF